MNIPKCKKCGKPLHDPLSIALGMGPECRGDSGRTHASAHLSQRRRSPSAYDSVGCSKAARAQALATGAPVTLGKDPRTGQVVSYQPDGAGNYINHATGHTMSAQALAEYMERYGWLDKTKAPAATGA